MATYSFKSVGQTKKQIEEEKIQASPIPYGIKTPVALGDNAIMQMNYSVEDQLSDNLKNLLLTNWGERLGLYKFGANLKPLTTEFVAQEDFDNQAILRIKSAVETWMPYIELEDFTSQIDRVDNKNTAVIKITVSYNIPALEVVNKRTQIVLYVI